MKKLLKLSALTALLCLTNALAVNGSAAQRATQEQLIGTWTPVAIYNARPDGGRVDIFGANPKGFLIFDATGRFFTQGMTADRAKFASNNRMQGTPEENKATVQGTIAYFGKYSVNEAEQTVTYHIEGSTFPNWEGIAQKRTFVLSADELTITNPASSVGGSTAQAIFRRIK